MEEGHQLVRYGMGGVGPPTLGRSQSLQGRHGPPALRSDPPWKDRVRGEGQDSRVAMVKPAVISGTTQTNRKTSLTRSVSLSDKELREARDRSQIIAAQLNFQSNANSRGVQLFNRRKQRVNAFTRTSYGQGAGQGGDGHLRQPVTWEEKHAEREDSQSDCRNNDSDPAQSPGVVKEGGEKMEEERVEPVPLEGIPATCVEEERYQDLSEQCEVREPTPKEDMPHELTPIEVAAIEETPTEPMPCEVKDCEATPCTATLPEATPPDDIETTAVLADVDERAEVVTPAEVTNGCHVTPNTTCVTLSLVKQAPTIINRTARPFGSTATVRSPEDFPPPPSCVTPPLPRIYSPPPPAFSPPPPMTYSAPPLSAYSDPNPPAYSNTIPQAYSSSTQLAYSSPTAQSYSNPSPPAYSNRTPQVYAYPAPPAYSSPPPLSRVISPSPCLPQYGLASVPRPTYVPELLGDRQPDAPIKTGILEDGKSRRATRKSMFTFQEKPKVAPNPELLSLVQGVDERKKGPSLPEHTLEEELLALGAEASNFLPKGGDDGGTGLEVTAMPEWSSCLKSSGARVRQEPKVEQGLTNVSGKGAELFARRQSRMERFTMESAGGAYGRAPSPTASLPPSWTFPSNMPGRVKAMVDVSNSNIGSSVKAPPARTAKPRPGVAKAPVPPRPESPVLENGCTKLEMEISRHQPYQLNSSLFIFNPTRDPMSSLPKAAPPPKPILDRAHVRQTSLTNTPPPLSPHFTSPAPFRPFSPQVPPSPVNGGGFPDLRSNCTAPPPWPGTAYAASPVSARSPERMAAPRSIVQAPRPTFSAKKAGIEPQTRRESLPTPPMPKPTTPIPMATPTTSQQLRRFSSPEGLEARCQSPLAGPDAKANRRLLAQNIINAAKRKNSPSPGGQNGRAACLSPFQPTLTSPPPTPTRSARSPVRLYATRSLTDSDASLESEDSGLRSPGLRSYNTCPRGWGGSLRIKRGSIPADL
ncbi:hypothetical protein SKAU_G00228400 [Synaphobranchus kaupii]|uniref:Synaptopodin n=1 Tax=Synaphobranchus kaupii TaxID=118154 RepID=A0A9Q1F556_SYNKA|nr:hypothetical protein SKAU_G00228400 [Synaphobranchus kaupii]